LAEHGKTKAIRDGAAKKARVKAGLAR